MFGDDGEHFLRLRLAGELEVEAAGLELEQLREQRGVVDVEAVRGVLVAARAGVDVDPGAFGLGEPVEDLVVEFDEAGEHAAAGVEPEREPALGEVELRDVRAGVERTADVGFGLAGQVGDERVAGSR